MDKPPGLNMGDGLPVEDAELVEAMLARADTLERLGCENRPLTSEYDVATVVLTREQLRKAAARLTALSAENAALSARNAVLEGLVFESLYHLRLDDGAQAYHNRVCALTTKETDDGR